MYIVKNLNEEILGYYETINLLRKSPHNDCLIPADKFTATGFSAGGNVYNLFGCNDAHDAMEASYEYVDGGELIYDLQQQISQLKAKME